MTIIPPHTLTPAQIAELLPKLDLIETWCGSVRTFALQMLEQGVEIPGFKVVEGRKAARKWGSEEQAQAMLESFRLRQDEMYSMKLITPTKAEELLAKSHPVRWEKLKDLVQQEAGRPLVVPASDKRAAITPLVDMFPQLDTGV